MEIAIVFALGTALFLALRDIFARLGMQGIDPVLGTAATAFTGLAVLACAAFVNGDFESTWPGWNQALLTIGLAGILRITVGRTTLFTAIKHIGAARSSSLGATNVFFAMFLGVFFLGEILHGVVVIGAILIVSGCVLVARSRAQNTAQQSWQDYTVGMAFALGSALAMATSAVLARSVMHDFSSPVGANFYASAIALVSYLPLIWSRKPRMMFTWSRRTWIFLWLIGLVSAAGTTSGYFALKYAPVVVVQPISQARPLFVLLISWVFLQAYEEVNWKVTVGALAIVCGTGLLILTT